MYEGSGLTGPGATSIGHAPGRTGNSRRATPGHSALRSERAAGAIGVIAVLLLSSFLAPAGFSHFAGVSPSAPSVSSTVSPGASASPSAVPTATEATGSGACDASSNAPAGTVAAARSAASGDAPHPSAVLYNHQVAPYAVWTGPYDYVAAGAALRDQGYGKIDLTWPGAPSTSNLVAAYMIWSLLNNSTPPSYATLNGVSLTGTWTAFATPSPCWSPVYIYTYVADVTSEVLNGVNTLTDFPSTNTTGVNPWANTGNESGLLDDGASLVAIYNAGGSTIHQVSVYSGAHTDGGGLISADLNFSSTTAKAATTTYIIADGQLGGNEAIWNGSRNGIVLSPNAFRGDDPKETALPWTEGNLSDTKTFAVSVPVGASNITAAIESTEGDCLTWVGQVLDVQVAAQKGPYPVAFQEQGLTPGIDWTLKINGASQTTAATAAGSFLNSTLANGSYSYAVTPIAGFSGPYHGSIVVDGGAVYLRLAFHQSIYAILATETGLPSEVSWWFHLFNVSQALSENLSEFSPTSISFGVPNGTYTFRTGEYGLYVAEPKAGTIVIDGNGKAVAVTFVPPPLYAVTFFETGLNPGTQWGGEVFSNFGDSDQSSSTRSIVVDLPNATYTQDYFEVNAIVGYTAQSTYRYFAVTGAPKTVDVNFSESFTVSLHETGLPGYTYWGANLTGGPEELEVESYSSYVNFTVTNGSYSFFVDHIWSYVADPSTGPVTVSAANVSVPVVFSDAPTYTLNFTESGLPAGTSWTVDLRLPNYEQDDLSGTGPTISYTLPNGTYFFEIVPISGYSASPASGDKVVAGADSSEPIVFTQVFPVRFAEIGLPTGSYWYVEFDYSSLYGYGPTLVDRVANGTYPFTAYTVDTYVPSPAEGSITVAGAGVTQTINFSSTTAPVFDLNVTEHGLPAGTNWSAELNDEFLWSTTSTNQFLEPNGTYSLEIANVGSYVPSLSSAEETIDGANVTVSVGFSVPVAYVLTFTESGLASGAEWWVYLYGYQYSTSTTDGFSEVNGTYEFDAGASGYSADPATGSVTVEGANVDQTIDFSAVEESFGVTFVETGLPSGTEWWANVTGGPSLASSTGTAETELPNGTYPYTIGTLDKSYAASGSSFTVQGSAVEVEVTFAPVLFEVTFTESGLPSETDWWVNVTEGPSLPSDSTTATVQLPNGSYAFHVGTKDKSYAASPGDFTVAGAAVPVSVDFAAVVFTVTFTETGLPADATWWVNLSAGQHLEVTDATETTISLGNGSYPYTASTTGHMLTAPGGTVHVDGKTVSVTVRFAVPANSPAPGLFGLPGMEGVWLVGILCALGLIAALFFVLGRRRKKKEEPAPPGAAGTVGPSPPPPPP